MKYGFTTLIIVSLLMSCCRYSTRDKSKQLRSDDRLWTYNCEYKRPFFRNYNGGSITLKVGDLVYIDIETGNIHSTKKMDTHFINFNNRIIQEKTGENTCKLSRWEEDRIIWEKSNIIGELLTFNADIYLLNDSSITKISYETGEPNWKYSFDEKVEKGSICYYHTLDNFYINTILKNEYVLINNNNGLTQKFKINPLVNKPFMSNLGGFKIQDDIFYVNRKKELIKLPDTKVDNWSNIINDTQIKVYSINNKIITINYLLDMPTVFTSFEVSTTPLASIGGIFIDNRNIIKVWDLDEKNYIVLNEVVDADIKYGYVLFDRIIVTTNDNIQVFDKDLNRLWTLPFVQIPNFTKMYIPKIIWLSDDYALVFEDGTHLTCFKIPKDQ